MTHGNVTGPYDVKLRETLRALRGDLSAAAFADSLAAALRRRISRTQISRWEAGTHTPGADVLLAAMAVSSTPREELPTPAGQDARSGAAAVESTRLDNLELQIGVLRQFQERVERAFSSI